MIACFFRCSMLLPLLIAPFIYAQDSLVTSDFETWTGINIEKTLFDKKLDLSLTQEFRFNDNSSHLDNFFTELGGRYEIIEDLKIGVGYRFIRNKRNTGDRNENRWNADLSYKHQLDRFTLSYRFMYTNYNVIGITQDEGDYPTHKYRLRLKAKYNIKNWKLDPYISVEGFLSQEAEDYNFIETITETRQAFGFEKMRYTIGTSYKLAKFFEIGAFYRIEHGFKSYTFNYGLSTIKYIGGLNLNFNF